MFDYDLRARANPNCYDVGRGGQQPLLLVVHNTAGKQDNNDPKQFSNTAKTLSDASASYLANNTAPVSVHYLIGAEAAGAPIYYIVDEANTAWHAGGNPDLGFPSTWVYPEKPLRRFQNYGVNQISIGIEMFGQVKAGDVGPSQQASATLLVTYLVKKYPILAQPGHIVSHMALEKNRSDGPNWIQVAHDAALAAYSTQQVPTPPIPTPAPFDPNPKKLQVGLGVLAALTAHEDRAVTNEQYMLAAPGQTFGTRSITWGEKHRYLGFDKGNGTWDIRVYDEVA